MPDKTEKLPEVIHLCMVNRHWLISYSTTSSNRYRLVERDHNLTITGPDRDIDACRDKLRQWLRSQAKTLLSQRLSILSTQTGH